jgi:hypothetical protein
VSEYLCNRREEFDGESFECLNLIFNLFEGRIKFVIGFVVE